MRHSAALLAAVMAVLQVSASPANVLGRGDSSVPPTPTPTLPGTEIPAPSVSGGFPTGSFSLPSDFPSGISESLPPFPSGTGFTGPSGGCGIPFPSGISIPFPSGSDASIPSGFPSGVSIPGSPGSIYTDGGFGASAPTDCASGYSFPTGPGPSDGIPTPTVSRPSGTGTFHPPSFLTTVSGILPPA